MVKKINNNLGFFLFFVYWSFIPLFFFFLGFLGSLMVWVVVIHLFGFVHQKLTEIIGETWGSFFLSLSLFLSLIIFFFFF